MSVRSFVRSLCLGFCSLLAMSVSIGDAHALTCEPAYSGKAKRGGVTAAFHNFYLPSKPSLRCGFKTFVVGKIFDDPVPHSMTIMSRIIVYLPSRDRSAASGEPVKIEAEDHYNNSNVDVTVRGSCASYVTNNSNNSKLVTLKIEQVGKSCDFVIIASFYDDRGGNVSTYSGTFTRLSEMQYQIEANSEILNGVPPPDVFEGAAE